ncbi:hypothetical protein BGW80DRAFT_13835 [Lactifluus volemus]|nr:hypothetical protein BGW80DRAFT_13835 [Lactifluus volemus]
MTGRSRSSVRGAPHAPHSNIQVVLPAPLSSTLHSRGASENIRGQRATISNNMYSDVWRNSLADSWVSVGQRAIPEPKSMERQSVHDSMEGQNRSTRRDSSPRSQPRLRCSSNPNPLPHPRLRRPSSLGPSPNNHPSGPHPPIPHIPSEFGTPLKRDSGLPSTLTAIEHD